MSELGCAFWKGRGSGGGVRSHPGIGRKVALTASRVVVHLVLAELVADDQVPALAGPILSLYAHDDVVVRGVPLAAAWHTDSRRRLDRKGDGPRLRAVVFEQADRELVLARTVQDLERAREGIEHSRRAGVQHMSGPLVGAVVNVVVVAPGAGTDVPALAGPVLTLDGQDHDVQDAARA